MADFFVLVSASKRYPRRVQRHGGAGRGVSERGCQWCISGVSRLGNGSSNEENDKETSRLREVA